MNRIKTISIIAGIAAVVGVAAFFAKDSNPSVETFGSSTYIGGRTSQGLPETYTNVVYGFSFSMPQGFAANEIEEEGGVAILIKGSDPKKEFQIFVSEFDEAGPITPERIKKDLPSITIEEPQQVLIGEAKKIDALIFFSRHESLGKTREVWFVWPPEPTHGNYLYRITAYAGMDDFLGPILETWRF